MAQQAYLGESAVSDTTGQAGRLLAAEDDIQITFLFGSAARYLLRADSDLDIAVAARGALNGRGFVRAADPRARGLYRHYEEEVK